MNKREIILKVLKNTTAHPTAEDIYLLLKKKRQNIGIATVYRHLRYLSRCGRLKQINTSFSSHYDADTSEHLHFICQACDRVYDMGELKKRFSLEKIVPSNFLVKNIDIRIVGLCSDCRKSKKQTKQKILV